MIKKLSVVTLDTDYPGMPYYDIVNKLSEIVNDLELKLKHNRPKRTLSPSLEKQDFTQRKKRQELENLYNLVLNATMSATILMEGPYSDSEADDRSSP